jgi:hypothetical protein
VLSNFERRLEGPFGLYIRVLGPTSDLLRENCEITRGREPAEGGLTEGLTRSDSCTKGRGEECMHALSLRTRERLELSNTTPLMVTSRGCVWEGPAPDGGRTVADGFALSVEVALEAWCS